MNKNTWRWAVPVLFSVLAFAPPAHTNMGIPPLFFLSWVAMVVALIPVIIVETIVLSMRAGVWFWESVLTTLVANLATTLLGIPLALILHATFRGLYSEEPERLETFWQKLRMVIWHIQYSDHCCPVN